MTVWILMISSIIFLRLIMGSLNTTKKKKKFLTISALIIIFVVGSRNGKINYGSDLNNYYRIYISAIESSWNVFFNINKVDVGYLLLNKLLAAVFPWPQFIIYFVAALTVSITFRFIILNSDDVFLSVLFFLSLGTFGFFLTGFRQSIAIVLCLFAFEFVLRKKMLLFIIIVLVASTIHQTAIIFLIFYYIGNKKLTTVNNIITFLLFFVVIFFADTFLSFGNEIFDRNFVAIGSQSNLGGIINLIIYVSTIILTMIFLNNNKDKQIDRKFYALLLMLVLGTGIYLMRFHALIMERISFYFLPAIIPLLPSMLQRIKEDNISKAIYFVALSGSIGMFIWRVATIKYTFFWEGISLW